nr:slipin family protein [Acidobacteriota bacterium]
MTPLVTAIVIAVIVALILLGLSLHIVTQYETGVLFRLGRVVGT